MSFLILAALLALPVYAVRQLGSGFYWLGIFGFALKCIAYCVYAVDKRRAEEGAWRISEAQLHLLELFGGWPGAFLAQRRLRHKCSKGSFLFVFWLIVLGYQLAAVDSLQDWKISRAGVNWIEETSRHRR